MHEAYQFLSWKYSRMRDLNKPGDGKAAEAEDVINTYRDISAVDEDDNKSEVVEISRPKTATGVSDKRKRRTKSAKASFAGRQPPKPIEPIMEAAQENAANSSNGNNPNASSNSNATTTAGGQESNQLPKGPESRLELKSEFLDKARMESSSDEHQPPEKKVELENENMEEYLERMSNVIARMIAEEIGID